MTDEMIRYILKRDGFLEQDFNEDSKGVQLMFQLLRGVPFEDAHESVGLSKTSVFHYSKSLKAHTGESSVEQAIRAIIRRHTLPMSTSSTLPIGVQNVLQHP